MLGWLADPFDLAIMQRALAEVLLLGVACGPLGVWVLLYRSSYAAESLSHGMLPGLVAAALLGLPLVLGALAGVLVAAGAIALAARAPGIDGEVGIAVTITTLFGLGSLLALSPATPARLNELLFGDLLGVSARDVATGAVLAGAVALALAVAYRPLSLSAFDPAAAGSLGARPGRARLALLVLLGVTTVAAVQGLGSLLLLALVLAPGAAALRRTRRLPVALGLAAALAALAGVAGLLVSYHLDVAAGAAVAWCAVATFVVAAAMPGGPRVASGA